MHIHTHLKQESQGKTGLGIYPDGMVEHDGMVGQGSGGGVAIGAEHGWILLDQRMRAARPERAELSATRPTAPRKIIEPMTLIWTGRALRWIE